MMSRSEHHEYLCNILAKLVDSVLTADELRDLASALGISVGESTERRSKLMNSGGQHE